MDERIKVEKIGLAGQDPMQPFYLAVSIGNLDGTLEDLGGEGVEGIFALETEATDRLRELNDDYPTLEGYVFLCTPIKRVWRGPTRVTPVSLKKTGAK